MRFLGIIVLLLVACGPVSGMAAPASEQRKDSETILETLERSHDTLSRELDTLSERVDLFLSGSVTGEESKESYVRAGLSTVFLKGGEIRFDRVFSAKIDLPNTEKRFHLLLESDPERGFRNPVSPGARSSTESETLTRQGPGTNFSTAIQYLLQERRKWLMSLDGGIQVEFPPDPFARARLRRSFAYGNWRFTFAETLFWFVSLGPGESTQFVIERNLPGAMLLRCATEALYREREDGFDLSQSLSIYQELSPREVMTYKAGVTGEAKQNNQLRDWGLGVEYRRRIYKNWLYFSVEPAVVFSKDNEFRADPSIRLTIDVSFGPQYVQ